MAMCNCTVDGGLNMFKFRHIRIEGQGCANKTRYEWRYIFIVFPTLYVCFSNLLMMTNTLHLLAGYLSGCFENKATPNLCGRLQLGFFFSEKTNIPFTKLLGSSGFGLSLRFNDAFIDLPTEPAKPLDRARGVLAIHYAQAKADTEFDEAALTGADEDLVRFFEETRDASQDTRLYLLSRTRHNAERAKRDEEDESSATKGKSRKRARLRRCYTARNYYCVAPCSNIFRTNPPTLGTLVFATPKRSSEGCVVWCASRAKYKPSVL